MNKIKVLIIDDDEDILAKPLTEKLNLNGFTAEYAVSGEEGLARIKAENDRRFDAVICDLRMPGIDGTKVFEELQKIDPNICFIMLTGFGIPNPVSLIKNGAHQYFQNLKKPLEIDQIDEFLWSIRRGVIKKKIRMFEEKVLTTIDFDEIFTNLSEAVETIFSRRDLGVAIVEREGDKKFKITKHKNLNVDRIILENNGYVKFEGFVQNVFEKQEPLLVRRIDEQNYKDVLPLSKKSTSLLAFPMVVLGNFYGILVVEGIEFEDYEKIEVDALNWFGNISATALHNYKSHNRILDETIKNFRALMHQCKMPLHNIQLSVSYLLDNLESKPMGQIKEGLERVYRYSVDAEEMTKNVLINYKDEKSTIGLSQIIKIAKVRFAEIEREKNITILWPKKIEGDISCKADQIIYVLQTIIENGIDAINKRGIDDGRVEIIVKTDDRNVEVQICDNGNGIKDCYKDKILERIFTTKSDSTGSGIGLFLSNSFVEGHDGNIKFESAPGDTRFFVTLPVKAKNLAI